MIRRNLSVQIKYIILLFLKIRDRYLQLSNFDRFLQFIHYIRGRVRRRIHPFFLQGMANYLL